MRNLEKRKEEIENEISELISKNNFQDSITTSEELVTLLEDLGVIRDIDLLSLDICSLYIFRIEHQALDNLNNKYYIVENQREEN